MPVNSDHLEPNQLASVIRYHRKAAGLSRRELGELAQVGKTAIFDIEHGATGTRLSTLRRVLHVLNLRVDLRGPLVEHWRATEAPGRVEEDSDD